MAKIQTTHHYQPLIDESHEAYHKRFLVWYGGRGAAKSWQIAQALIFRAKNNPIRVICAREFQNSISDSVKQLLTDTIVRMGLQSEFTVQNNGIYGKNGSQFSFKGLRHNIDSIKSFEGADVVWVEEAQTVSARSWNVLLPTIRKPGSQIIVSFNPDMESDPTFQRFITNPPVDSYVCKVNYSDNPWFTKELNDERLHLQSTDPDAYANVWGGEIWSRSEAQILANKWREDIFEPTKDWGDPLYGADWGFSRDPTVLSELYLFNDSLYIRREAVKVGLELDDTRSFWEAKIPGCSRKIIKGDNSRPETISYLKKHGIPLLKAAAKWPGSVEDGVTHLRKYKEIVIHSSCKNGLSEARMYRYKVDQRTEEVTKKIVDKHNHSVDSWRYGLDKLIKKNGIDYKKFNKM